jgi:hypothetical protein
MSWWMFFLGTVVCYMLALAAAGISGYAEAHRRVVAHFSDSGWKRLAILFVMISLVLFAIVVAETLPPRYGVIRVLEVIVGLALMLWGLATFRDKVWRDVVRARRPHPR